MNFNKLPILIVISIFFFSCESCTKESTEEPKPEKAEFYFGADMSSVNMVEDFGGVYKSNNTIQDPFSIFKNNGCNLVRVRLFHTPENPNGYNQWYSPGSKYCGLDDVTKTIKRAKNLGMKVSLDLHYSDTWADPANQKTPLAWEGLSLDIMKDSLYNYTKKVLEHLKTNNATPEMIQIGNEIDPGLLLPVGNTMSAVAVLLNQGIKAVRDFSKTSTIKPKIIIHYSDNSGTIYRAKTLATAGVTDYDILGISYYDKWGKIKFDELTNVIKDFKKQFSKEIMVVETSYQWTETNSRGYEKVQNEFNGYPATKSGQYNYIKDLTQHIIKGGGLGVIYWEPAWLPTSVGEGWDVDALFDFEGNVLPAIKYMNDDYIFP